MKPEYAPTPFSEALIHWLKATKNMPRFSRNLANFVMHRKAYRVIRLIPHKDTPSYRLHDSDPHMPLGRYNDGLVYLTHVIDEHPWTSRGWTNHTNEPDRDIRGTRLSTVRREGGSACVYTSFEPMADWDWEDATLDFWERYMKIGTCLFDHKHLHPAPGQFFYHRDTAESRDRWKMLDEQTAQCRWCGDILHLHRAMDLEVRCSTKWVHDEVNPGKTTFRCARCHRPHPIADKYQTLNHAAFKADDLCPSCFLARAAGEPSVRRKLLERGMGSSKAII